MTDSTVTAVDKMALVAETGRLEGEMSEWEDKLRKAEQELKSAQTSRTIGVVGIILGLIGLFIFWPLVLLGAAGLLTIFTQQGKVNEIEPRVNAASAEIRRIRTRQAEVRALLAMA